MSLEIGDVAPPFRLRDQDGVERPLDDPEHTVLEAYGAWGETVLSGRTSIGVIRSSVLIGDGGRVLELWRRAQARTHAEPALKACRELLS